MRGRVPWGAAHGATCLARLPSLSTPPSPSTHLSSPLVTHQHHHQQQQLARSKSQKPQLSGVRYGTGTAFQLVAPPYSVCHGFATLHTDHPLHDLTK
ncbi:Hypothetical protein NTJ_04011 [Nesidiocoris tenuis]|uniref:Secreted protein n=1 Tax=Nesidiocoris tenuis TaxID=355587 RepID=A0ABN7AGM7_9HEMI|nr:Hypothetical protein NTJ_04011 [Nesidiocoris tenuis]